MSSCLRRAPKHYKPRRDEKRGRPSLVVDGGDGRASSTPKRSMIRPVMGGTRCSPRWARSTSTPSPDLRREGGLLSANRWKIGRRDGLDDFPVSSCKLCLLVAYCFYLFRKRGEEEGRRPSLVGWRPLLGWGLTRNRGLTTRNKKLVETINK